MRICFPVYGTKRQDTSVHVEALVFVRAFEAEEAIPDDWIEPTRDDDPFDAFDTYALWGEIFDQRSPPRVALRVVSLEGAPQNAVPSDVGEGPSGQLAMMIAMAARRLGLAAPAKRRVRIICATGAFQDHLNPKSKVWANYLKDKLGVLSKYVQEDGATVWYLMPEVGGKRRWSETVYTVPEQDPGSRQGLSLLSYRPFQVRELVLWLVGDYSWFRTLPWRWALGLVLIAALVVLGYWWWPHSSKPSVTTVTFRARGAECEAVIDGDAASDACPEDTETCVLQVGDAQKRRPLRDGVQLRGRWRFPEDVTLRCYTGARMICEYSGRATACSGTINLQKVP